MSQDGDGLVTTGLQSIDLKLLKDGTEVRHTNVLPRLLSYKDAGIYMSLSYWSLRTLVVNGEVAHVRFGKRVLLDRLALDRWVEEHLEEGV